MAFQLENIKEVNPVVKTESPSIEALLNKEVIVLKKPFSNKIKEDFYGELSVLLNAGINLKQALELVLNSQKNKKTKAIIESVLNQVVQGKSFSESIKTCNDFTEYEICSLEIGEETGTTAKIMEQLTEFYSKKNEQRRQLINALTYPVIIFCTALFVVIFMLQFVVPMFQDIFKQQNVELPGITQFVVNISDFVQSKGLLLLLGFLGLIITLYIVRDKTWYRQFKDKSILKLPLIGKFMKTIYLSQFSQSMMLLSSSKVPIVESLALVKKMIGFYPLSSALTNVEQRVLSGLALSASLQKESLFDDRMVTLVKVSEETNQTEFVFNKLNSYYNTKVQSSSKMLSTLLEPFIIMFIGLFVGFILIAMYLPMFRLSSII